MVSEGHKAGYILKWNTSIYSVQYETQIFSKTFLGVWEMNVGILVKLLRDMFFQLAPRPVFLNLYETAAR
jgi:hypothetical protein